MATSVIPQHIDPIDVENLAATLAVLITEDPEMAGALEICNLQPTSRAAHLAANAAVNVLLAHEIGQEAGNES